MTDPRDYLAPLFEKDPGFGDLFEDIRYHLAVTGQLPEQVRSGLEKRGDSLPPATEKIDQQRIANGKCYTAFRIFPDVFSHAEILENPVSERTELAEHKTSYIAVGFFERGQPENEHPLLEEAITAHITPRIVSLQRDREYSHTDLRYLSGQLNLQTGRMYQEGICMYQNQSDLLLAIPPESTNSFFDMPRGYLDSKILFWYLHDNLGSFVHPFEDAILQNQNRRMLSHFLNFPQLCYKESADLTHQQIVKRMLRRKQILEPTQRTSYQELQGTTDVTLFSGSLDQTRNFKLTVRREVLGFNLRPLITIENLQKNGIPLLMLISNMQPLYRKENS